MPDSHNPDELLRPYVPRLLISWLRDTPDARHREVEGTLAFVDISGFTKMTERLARKGKVGAEEVNDALDDVFRPLLDVAYDYGAGVVKWGGDAVLLLFDEDEHAPRAARAAIEMQRTLRTVGRMSTSSGQVTLRMSLGLHSGVFQFFLVGDLHRELLVAGPGASRTVDMEAIADAGEVALSPETAALLDPKDVGAAKGEALLLRRAPVRVEASRIRARRDRPRYRDVPCETDRRAPARGARRAGAPSRYRRVHRVPGPRRAAGRHGAAQVSDDLDELIGPCSTLRRGTASRSSRADISKDGGKIMLIAGAPATTGRDEEQRCSAPPAHIVDARPPDPDPHRRQLRSCVRRELRPPVPPHLLGRRVTPSTRAAPIMGKAELGEVLATEAMSCVRARFGQEPRGPFHLEGQGATAGRIRHRHRRAPARRGTRSPLVGRDAELADGWTALAAAAQRPARDGSSSSIGEPGVGKSRLVDELPSAATTSRSSRSPATSTSGDAVPRRSGRACARARSRRGTTARRGRARLRRGSRAGARSSSPGCPPRLPLDVEVAPTPEADQLEERFRRERLDRSRWTTALTAHAEPTILVFDDVHWMDEASAEAAGPRRAARGGAPLARRRRRGATSPAGFARPVGARHARSGLEPLAARRRPRRSRPP